MLKVAVISYHANAYQIYPLKWLEEYRDSIMNQTFQAYDLFEVNYGKTVGMIFWKSKSYQSREFPTFVHCMNWMLDYLFDECGYDVVFNSNVDDIFHPQWMEKSLAAVKSGADLVSCNFQLFNEHGIYHSHHFARLDIKKELDRNHNVLCHPAIAYTKNFWSKGHRYVPDDIPYEDLKLWQRAVNDSKIIILPDHLLLHRVHDNAVCRSNNR